MSSSRLSGRYGNSTYTTSSYGTTTHGGNYTSAYQPQSGYTAQAPTYTSQSYTTQAPTYTSQQAPTYTSQSYTTQQAPITQSYTSQSYSSSSRTVPNQKWGIRIPTSEEGRQKVEDQMKGGYGEQWGGATVTTDNVGLCIIDDEQSGVRHVKYNKPRDLRDNACAVRPHVTIVGRGEQVLIAEKKVLSILGQYNQPLYHPIDVDLTNHEPNRHHEGSYNKWGHKVPCTESGRQQVESQIRNGGFGGATVSTEVDGCYGPTVLIMGSEEQVAMGKRKVAAILGDRVDDNHEDVHYKKIECHPRQRWQETVKQQAPPPRKAATVHVPVTRQILQEVTESEGEY